MSRYALTFLLVACVFVPAVTSPVLANAADAAAAAPASAKSLQARAADPTEPLIQFSIFNDLAITNRGGEGVANQVLIQPVIPLPAFDWFPVGQIIRPSLAVITTPHPGRITGIGDLTLFDIFLPERFAWGSFGVGPVAVFPTATDDRLGQGKWQFGPAAALMYEAIPNLQLGVILQNPISVAGKKSRAGVNQLLVQPIVQYNFPDGWYVSMGDFSWTFDWKKNGKATIPVAAQVGRVLPIFGQQWNLAVEPFYVAAHDSPSARWGIRFGITLLLPEGP